MELVNDLLLEVLVANYLPNLLLSQLILNDNLLLIPLILRVLHAVMPEVEGLSWLDDLAEPSAKVCVVYLRSLLNVFHLNQYLEDVEVELRVAAGSSDKFCEIFSCDESVVVLIEV